MSTKNFYQIIFAFSKHEASRTNDSIYVVMYGPNGSTEKIPLSNSRKVNETERPKYISKKYQVEAREAICGDIGLPFAISVILDGDDAIEFNWVKTKRYKETDGGEELLDEAGFPFQGALGEKGDFDLAEEKKFVTIYRDGNLSLEGEALLDATVKEMWLVEDNRGSTGVGNGHFSEKIQSTMSTLFSQTTSNSITLAMSASMETGSFFGPSYKYKISAEVTEKVETTDQRTLSREFEQEFDYTWEVPSDMILFKRVRVGLKSAGTEYKVGNSSNITLNVVDPTVNPEICSLAIDNYTFNNGEDIPEDLQVIYSQVEGKTWSPTV